VVLAPLAGVSDHPFRRLCASQGADLTYVEMLSARALCYQNPRTLAMARRDTSETILGVQLTGSEPEDIGLAVALLDRENFDTIDINMGCPVAKVTNAGSGSALMRDPRKVAKIVTAAREATKKPLSVKIRLGWKRPTIDAWDVVRAIEDHGADWITLHGRFRSDDYSAKVDLDRMREIRARTRLPVWGNGQLLHEAGVTLMGEQAGVDGFMVSRGALGNPWIFGLIKGTRHEVSVDDWLTDVLTHLRWQSQAYGDEGRGAIVMRKHLLWYMAGWPHAKKLKERFQQLTNLREAEPLLRAFAEELAERGHVTRAPLHPLGPETEGFVWNPRFDMDRQLDRGVGDETEVCDVQ
jgi:nifR3 family TIM-barrel protein